MRRIYEFLLGLYPAEVRTSFAPEMSDVFAQVAEDRRREGWFPFAAFVLGELIGLLTGAAAAHRAARQPVLDLRMMRPPGVSRKVYGIASDELIAAQRLVDFNPPAPAVEGPPPDPNGPTIFTALQEQLVGRMQQAIARQDFVKARFYSDEDRKARLNLRIVRRKYGVPE